MITGTNFCFEDGNQPSFNWRIDEAERSAKTFYQYPSESVIQVFKSADPRWKVAEIPQPTFIISELIFSQRLYKEVWTRAFGFSGFVYCDVRIDSR